METKPNKDFVMTTRTKIWLLPAFLYGVFV